MVMDTAIGPTAITAHRPIMADPMAIMVVHMPITVGLMATTVVPESASALPSEATGKKRPERNCSGLANCAAMCAGGTGVSRHNAGDHRRVVWGHRAACIKLKFTTNRRRQISNLNYGYRGSDLRSSPARGRFTRSPVTLPKGDRQRFLSPDLLQSR